VVEAQDVVDLARSASIDRLVYLAGGGGTQQMFLDVGCVDCCALRRLGPRPFETLGLARLLRVRGKVSVCRAA